MAGTKEGGKKAAATNKLRHGDGFYARIGSRGGSKSHPETRWFAQNPKAAAEAGSKGGKISKRGAAKKNDEYKKKIADIRLAELEEEEYDD